MMFNNYANAKTIVFFNGQFIPYQAQQISMHCQSLHYGYATFEGIRAYRTQEERTHIFKAKAHFERFHQAAKLLHLPLNYSVTELKNICYQLLEKNNFRSAYIRPLLFAGDKMDLRPSKNSHLLIFAWRWPQYFKEKQLKLGISNTYCRPTPNAFPMEVKISGAYVSAMLASREAHSQGYDEALLLDRRGYIAQAAGANFFFEKDNKLYTPKTGSIFLGITRQIIMEIAAEMNIEIVQASFKPKDLKHIDGAFLTGTAVGVTPVISINGQKMQLPIEDTLGHNIAQCYNNLVTLKDNSSLVI